MSMVLLFKDYSKWTRQGQRSLEQSLHMAVKAWYSECSGVPDILYFLPEQLGSMDCIIPVYQDKIKEVEGDCQIDVEDDMHHEYFEH